MCLRSYSSILPDKIVSCMLWQKLCLACFDTTEREEPETVLLAAMLLMFFYFFLFADTSHGWACDTPCRVQPSASLRKGPSKPHTVSFRERHSIWPIIPRSLAKFFFCVSGCALLYSTFSFYRLPIEQAGLLSSLIVKESFIPNENSHWVAKNYSYHTWPKQLPSTIQCAATL